MLVFLRMAFSSRPAANCTIGVDGSPGSRRAEFPCVRGVSECAESNGSSRLRTPLVLSSAMLNDVGTPITTISQLSTLPALPPVNASMGTSRLSTHDSGPKWFATPFLYDSFIHNSTPVYPGALSSLLKQGSARFTWCARLHVEYLLLVSCMALQFDIDPSPNVIGIHIGTHPSRPIVGIARINLVCSITRASTWYSFSELTKTRTRATLKLHLQAASPASTNVSSGTENGR